MDESHVTALVLLAAVLHASWNALVKAGPDKLMMQGLVIAGGGLCMALALPFVAFPERAAWPYLAVSAVLHLTYNTSLVRAYQRGDLSQVYPIARGAAPAFVALGAWWVEGEALTGREIAGLATLSAGIVSLAFAPDDGAFQHAAVEVPARGLEATPRPLGVLAIRYEALPRAPGRPDSLLAQVTRSLQILRHAELLQQRLNARRQRLAGPKARKVLPLHDGDGHLRIP